jgi:hypothetical protein
VNSIDQIAKVTGQEPTVMKSQFDDIHPRVLGFANSSAGNSNKDCWKHVMDLARHNNKRACNLHPIESINEGCILYYVFGLSSSGVEQHFSNTGWKFRDRRFKASNETEEYVIRIVSDLGNHDINDIIQRAKTVWLSLYGAPRKCSGNRFTLGVKRKRKSLDVPPEFQARTEQDFIAKRRRASAAVGASSSEVYESLITVDDPSTMRGWSEKHSKELNFQNAKLHSRRVQAVAEGVIEDASLHKEVTSAHDKRCKDQRARERKAKRDDVKLHGTTSGKLFIEIAGRPCFVLCNKTPELISAMRNASMKEVKPLFADVFISDRPGQLGSRISLVTSMRGCFHVSAQLVTSRGASGIGVKWRSMAEIPRIIYVSAAANSQNPHAFKILQHVLGECKCNRVELRFGGGDLSDLTPLINAVTPKSKLIAIMRSGELSDPVSILALNINKLY